MNTGGPAFPLPDTYHPNGQVQFGTSGMTLLDWYAGQALAGLVARVAFSGDFDAAASYAHKHAEAMLSEKARREAAHSGDANQMDSAQLTPDGYDVFDGTKANHSPDASEMVMLKELNRELVEALEMIMGDDATEGCDQYRKVAATSILAKAKGVA